MYPDYMEKTPAVSFKGTSFIAESYRRLVKHRKQTAPNIKKIAVDTSLLYKGMIDMLYWDFLIMRVGYEDHVEEARQIYLEYVEDNMQILRQYGIQSEAEILTGNILKCSKRFDKKKD